MTQTPLNLTVTNKTGQDLYGEYPTLNRTSCCSDATQCKAFCTMPIFAARSAPVQVQTPNYTSEGAFSLRTGSKNDSPVKASFLFKDLMKSPNVVVESDEQSPCNLAPPCNLAQWQIATIIGVFGWLMCIYLFFTRT